MNGNEITYLLRKNGSSGAKIARQLGVSRPAVSQVAHGVSISSRIQNAIASAICKSVDEVFPPKEKKAV